MDISFLRERDNPGSFSVTELNNYIKNLFDGNRTLSAVTVKGEISNFKNHSTGHLYFSLKDEEGQIRAVMFRSKAMSLKFMPESGMRVIAHGSVTIYPRDGSYQLYVNSLQPDGIGALYLAYEQLKDKLYQEGLFDESHKKPIPYAPQSVGVITSPTGAAVRDIINVISRRFPIATVYLYPALVQGEGAEESLISGLDYFEKSALADVIILGRGGGSIEDLWAFNGERLARKIFAATTPIISAVGHETDFTIADFVSDLRAPTPSAAAELAVPDSKELLMRIDGIGESGSRALERRLERARESVNRLSDAVFAGKLRLTLDSYKQRIEGLFDKARSRMLVNFENSEASLALKVGMLETLNPLRVLTRGYSIAEKGGVRISSTEQISVGDDLKILFTDGSAEASVSRVIKENL